jgi:two-component sensor histidine kinase
MGEILVKLERTADDFEISVGDDGIGLPQGFDPRTSGGTGWSLIRILTEQIDGQMNLESAKGTRVLIRFSSPTEVGK